MVVRSGFLPLSRNPKALLTGLKLAAGDKSVQLGVGLMAGLGGAQGAYNAVNKLKATESDRQRVHQTLEAIRKGGADADAHAYGAMFGSVRHYDDPKPVKHLDPVVNFIGQTVKPYEKAINTVNYGRLVHEADGIDMANLMDRMREDMGTMNRISKNLEGVVDEEGNPYPKEAIEAAIARAYNRDKVTTDEDIVNADKASEIARKAKMLKGMMDETNRSSILTNTQEGFAEQALRMSGAESLGDLANLLKKYRDSQ